MNRVAHISILGSIGLLAFAVTGATARGETAPSTPPQQSLAAASLDTHAPVAHAAASDNPLRVVGISDLNDAGPAGTIRFVQATEAFQSPTQTPTQLPADSGASQPEQIGSGTEQGPLQALPPTEAVPGNRPGTYEQIGLGWKPIGAVTASIAAPAGELPVNQAAPVFAQAGVVAAPVNASHNWPTFTYAWEASAVPHNPLWFEDVNLERYGYTHGILQPWISGGRFFINVVFLPYHIVAEPPGTLEYPLGYYRPGDAAPPVRQIKPVKPLAAVAEAAFIIGMIIILP